MTIEMCLRTGLHQDELIAPMVTDGPMDGAMFLVYIRCFLVPALRPGDIVNLDNLSSYEVRGVREAIMAARTVDALWNEISTLLGTLSPNE